MEEDEFVTIPIGVDILSLCVVMDAILLESTWWVPPHIVQNLHKYHDFR